jgi:uncharacterized protein with FMN-binding domain
MIVKLNALPRRFPRLHALSASTGARVPGRRRPSWRVGLASVVAILLVYAIGYVRTEPARSTTAARPVTGAAYRDGTYSGWGRARHGRVFATVVIRRGRIVSAEITDCRMKYPCSMIAALPPRVVARQSPEVDIVSGATHSTEAFTRAVSDALAQAARAGHSP